MQLDVPVLLTDLRLALDHLCNQLPPLPVDLLDLAHLPLKSLPQLSPLLPRLIQLPLHLLAHLCHPLEVGPRH